MARVSCSLISLTAVPAARERLRVGGHQEARRSEASTGTNTNARLAVARIVLCHYSFLQLSSRTRCSFARALLCPGLVPGPRLGPGTEAGTQNNRVIHGPALASLVCPATEGEGVPARLCRFSPTVIPDRVDVSPSRDPGPSAGLCPKDSQCATSAGSTGSPSLDPRHRAEGDNDRNSATGTNDFPGMLPAKTS